MAWLVWLGILATISLIFRWMYKYAEKIEEQERKEKEWIAFIEETWKTNPQEAREWMREFKKEFLE